MPPAAAWDRYRKSVVMTFSELIDNKKTGCQSIGNLFFHRIKTTRDHSHSIVAGGLLDTSYVTRLIPRTSLMMRDDTRFSSA